MRADWIQRCVPVEPALAVRYLRLKAGSVTLSSGAAGAGAVAAEPQALPAIADLLVRGAAEKRE